jgi:tetratricopeptide (TPR) repeat protein
MTRFLIALLLFSQANTQVEQAWKLAANGQRDQAISLLQQFLTAAPTDADARLLLGSLFMEAGRHDEAVEQLSEAVKLLPRSADAENALGEAYTSFGDYKNAQGPFEKAVALKPDFAVAQLNLGEALLNLGSRDASAQHLDRAIKLLGHGEDLANAHYLRAKLYTDAGDIAKAAAHLQQAVAMRPAFHQAWSDLGEARKTLQDDASALVAFQHAVELAPADAVAQYRLGVEYLDLNKPHDAVAHLETAYRLTPEDQSTLNALQRALRQDGRTTDADAIREKLSDLLRRRDEANQNALKGTSLNNEGAKLEQAGNLKDALEKYQVAARLAPESVPIRVNYAVALLRSGKWTEGLNELHAAALMDPSNSKIKQTLQQALAQAPVETLPDWAQKGRGQK